MRKQVGFLYHYHYLLNNKFPPRREAKRSKIFMSKILQHEFIFRKRKKLYYISCKGFFSNIFYPAQGRNLFWIIIFGQTSLHTCIISTGSRTKLKDWMPTRLHCVDARLTFYLNGVWHETDTRFASHTKQSLILTLIHTNRRSVFKGFGHSIQLLRHNLVQITDTRP